MGNLVIEIADVTIQQKLYIHPVFREAPKGLAFREPRKPGMASQRSRMDSCVSGNADLLGRHAESLPKISGNPPGSGQTLRPMRSFNFLQAPP
jgi:hypothetical protein